MNSLSRRSFFTGLVAAPLVIPVNRLMKLRGLIYSGLTLWGDDQHDDTDAMRAVLSGKLVDTIPGAYHLTTDYSTRMRLSGGIFRLDENPITEDIRIRHVMLNNLVWWDGDSVPPGVTRAIIRVKS